jgi:hypothetical protein
MVTGVAHVVLQVILVARRVVLQLSSSHLLGVADLALVVAVVAHSVVAHLPWSKA